MRLEDADRLAGLDQQRLIVVQVAQRFQNLVEACPVARRTADAAIYHQMLRVFRDFGIQIVLEHAVRGFRQPALAGFFTAARRANLACFIPARIIVQAGCFSHGMHRDSFGQAGNEAG